LAQIKIKILDMAQKKPITKLACTVCKTTNYFTKKTKKSAEKKLDLKKFCSSCKKHTSHKESKK
jgi:large subunit ribosomal protein L33